MSVHAASRATFDLTERQQAFVGLLTTPLVTPGATPDLHRLVVRHASYLQVWAQRLGYRLVSVGSVHRLRRIPLPGSAAVPAGPHPPRRVLVLALLTAATLEDVTGDSVTIQSLSDAVRDASGTMRTAYDPERHAERRALVQALSLLTDVGVLERRTTRDDLMREWEDRGTGLGAGYRINRDALVLLVDPLDSRAGRAMSMTDDSEQLVRDTRSERILRMLVETQGLLLGDLTATERDYWRSQRQQLLRRACEMTGATAELRAEGAVLILSPDSPWSTAATVTFPAATADSWVALALLDAAIAHGSDAGEGGWREWPNSSVDTESAQVHTRLGDRLTKNLRESAEAVRSASERELIFAGLLTVRETGDWLIPAYAGRYRAAILHSQPPAQAALLPSTSGEDPPRDR